MDIKVFTELLNKSFISAAAGIMPKLICRKQKHICNRKPMVLSVGTAMQSCSPCNVQSTYVGSLGLALSVSVCGKKNTNFDNH